MGERDENGPRSGEKRSEKADRLAVIAILLRRPAVDKFEDQVDFVVQRVEDDVVQRDAVCRQRVVRDRQWCEIGGAGCGGGKA